LAHIRDADGQPLRARVNYRSELVFVRAFYEDIARWAADDPADGHRGWHHARSKPVR
jgi:hypothetical protein